MDRQPSHSTAQAQQMENTLTFWHRRFTFNSNKSPTWCNSFSVYYPDVFTPIIRSSMAAVAASGFTFVSWWQPCCFRGRAGRPACLITNTARLSPRYEGKTRGFYCSHWTPDDGRESARNMLSCKQTSG
jgi:hypothetical protein